MNDARLGEIEHWLKVIGQGTPTTAWAVTIHELIASHRQLLAAHGSLRGLLTEQYATPESLARAAPALLRAAIYFTRKSIRLQVGFRLIRAAIVEAIGEAGYQSLGDTIDDTIA